MSKKREIILVEAYSFEQDSRKEASLDWKALEYNAYQKIYTPVASATTREALLDTLDLLFTGGSKEDKLKEKIKKIDPEVLARLIDKFESEKATEELPPVIEKIVETPAEVSVSETPKEASIENVVEPKEVK